MSIIDVNSCAFNVEVEGPVNAPALMLCTSLAANLHMWDPETPGWAKEFRVIRYDRRGHGKSAAPKGPYSIEMLGRDALAILDSLGVKRFIWCGLSLGGMVGMWLGANASDRVEKLILSNTRAYYPEKGGYEDRIKGVRENGLAPLADGNMERWFTKDFREKNPETVAATRAAFLETSVEGYVGCLAAIRDMDHREILGRITAPTLVIAGKQDIATPPEVNEYVRSRIPGATMTVFDTAHLSNIEEPIAYTAEVLKFLRR